jgi:hypothetical protein
MGGPSSSGQTSNVKKMYFMAIVDFYSSIVMAPVGQASTAPFSPSAGASLITMAKSSSSSLKHSGQSRSQAPHFIQLSLSIFIGIVCFYNKYLSISFL